MERIPLLTSEGAHIEWLTEGEARELLRKREANFVRRKGNIRALILRDVRAEVVPIDRGRNRPTRYSHDHEVAETYLDDHGNLRRRHPLDANPRGCWTLKRLHRSLRKIFVTSITDCISGPPELDDAA